MFMRRSVRAEALVAAIVPVDEVLSVQEGVAGFGGEVLVVGGGQSSGGLG